MALDLSALKKQREMIDTILRIASDPDAAPLLEKIIIENRLPEVAELQNRSRPIQKTFPEIAHPNGRGSQIAAIRKAVAARSSPFSVGDIGDELRASGVAIENIAVGRVLQRLAVKYSELAVTVRGEGSSPNRYEKTDKFRPAA